MEKNKNTEELADNTKESISLDNRILQEQQEIKLQGLKEQEMKASESKRKIDDFLIEKLNLEKSSSEDKHHENKKTDSGKKLYGGIAPGIILYIVGMLAVFGIGFVAHAYTQIPNFLVPVLMSVLGITYVSIIRMKNPYYAAYYGIHVLGVVSLIHYAVDFAVLLITPYTLVRGIQNLISISGQTDFFIVPEIIFTNPFDGYVGMGV